MTIQRMVKKNGFTITLQIIGFLALVLNLWLAGKLSPLAQDIAVITTRIDAIEVREADERSFIISKLNSIDNKIDDHLGLHASK